DVRDRDDDTDGPVRPDYARRPDRGPELQDVGWLKEPMCPEPEVHIILPPLAKLRAVVERMRPLAADVIGIRANLSGCLQLCAQTDNSRVDVAWNGLSNPRMAQDPSTQDPDTSDARGPTTLYGVLVSLRSLQNFLSSHVVSTTTIACICQNHCIILYVYIDEMAGADGILTFYIPAIIE
ncbi:checkpoint protein Hus1/Mec3, partial [Fomitopsis serialis]|uniref:checkpoint protein Hus1/Mec3 n=1 Tax=Fomitopsis serialis TaxID=139415 RepID=UPI00200737E5